MFFGAAGAIIGTGDDTRLQTAALAIRATATAPGDVKLWNTVAEGMDAHLMSVTTPGGNVEFIQGFADTAADTGRLVIAGPVNAGGTSVGGDISIVSQYDIVQTAAGNLATNNGGTVTLAAGSAVTMESGASTTALGDGIVRYIAGSGITTGTVHADSGNAAFIALNGSVTGNGFGGNTLAAAGIRFSASDGITGAEGGWLAIDAQYLSAAAGAGGFWLSESDSIQVTSIAAVTDSQDPIYLALVAFAGIDAATTALLAATQADLTTLDGGAVHLRTGADLVLLDGDENGAAVMSSGTTEIDNTGKATVSADIQSAGSVAFTGTGDVVLGADITVTNPGESISFADSALILNGNRHLTTDDGNVALDEIRTNAVDNHTLSVTAGAGNVLVDDNIGGPDAEPAGFIVESAGNVHFSGDAATIDIGTLTISASGQVRLDAAAVVGNDVGVTAESFDLAASLTAGGTITASAAAGSSSLELGTSYGTYLLTATDLVFTDPVRLLQDVTIDTSGGDFQIAGVTADTDGARSLTINVTDGNLTLAGPVGETGLAVGDLAITGTGSVTTLAAASIAAAGDITVSAQDDISIQASVASSGLAGISLTAGTDGTGALTLAGQMTSDAVGGDILLASGDNGGDIRLENILNAEDRLEMSAPAGAIVQETGSVSAQTGVFLAANGIYSLREGTPDTLLTALTFVDARVTGGGDVLLLNTKAVAATEILALQTLGGDIHFEQYYQEQPAGWGDTHDTPFGHLLIAGDVTSGSSTGIAGGNIEILSSNGMTVMAVVSTVSGSGGATTIANEVELVEGQASITVGAGNIILKGNETDDILIIDVPVSNSSSLIYFNDGDIIIRAELKTTSSTADITILADQDGDGRGGVIVEAGGSVRAGSNLLISGADAISTPGALDSVTVQDGAASPRLSAGGWIVIEHNEAAPEIGAIHMAGGVSAGGSEGITFKGPVFITGDLALEAPAVWFEETITAGASLTINVQDTLHAFRLMPAAGAANIAVDATVAAGNILLGTIDTGVDGTVTLQALQGVVADDLAEETANIITGTLTIQAMAAGVASGIDDLDVMVAHLDVRTSGFAGNVVITELAEGGGIVIDRLRIQGGGNLGLALVAAEAGGITVADGINGIAVEGGGDLLLLAQGASSDIQIDGPVLLYEGSVSVVAANGILFGSAGTIETTGSGTIDLMAVSGGIDMADSAAVAAVDGNVRFSAAGDISLTGLSTGGDASVVSAAGYVLDAAGSGVDIIADGVRIQAGLGVGTALDALEIRGATLAALTGSGGVFLATDAALDVGVVDPVPVNRVLPDGLEDVATDETLLGASPRTRTAPSCWTAATDRSGFWQPWRLRAAAESGWRPAAQTPIFTFSTMWMPAVDPFPSSPPATSTRRPRSMKAKRLPSPDRCWRRKTRTRRWYDPFHPDPDSAPWYLAAGRCTAGSRRWLHPNGPHAVPRFLPARRQRNRQRSFHLQCDRSQRRLDTGRFYHRHRSGQRRAAPQRTGNGTGCPADCSCRTKHSFCRRTGDPDIGSGYRHRVGDRSVGHRSVTTGCSRFDGAARCPGGRGDCRQPQRIRLHHGSPRCRQSGFGDPCLHHRGSGRGLDRFVDPFGQRRGACRTGRTGNGYGFGLYQDQQPASGGGQYAFGG